MTQNDKDQPEDRTVIAEINQLDAKPKTKSPASIVQHNGENLGKRYPLDKDSIKIGRSTGADIIIAEASVSRVHAHIFQKDGNTYIEDLSSANGTFLNETKTSGANKLKDQDMIRLGNLLLKYFSQDNMDGYIQDKIYRMATIDVGTQIFNKQYLLDTLSNACKQAKSSKKPLCILYFDLDHFKKVNDTYGHNAGDQVLRETAQIVKSLTRKDDTLARFGGEEFIIILPNTDKDTSVNLAERIRQACQNYSHILAHEDKGIKQQAHHHQTISVGIAQYVESMEDYKALLEAADKKLYFSKQNGRNRVSH